MNITSDVGDSIYIDVEGRGCRVYVSVHSYTFEPSTGIKNATNCLYVMVTIIDTNESLYPGYLVILETDGGGDHNHKNIRKKLAPFGLLILGIMHKLNVTCGFPGLSFINTSKRAMSLLNIGLSGHVLKSNVQVGHELLMYEVIWNATSMKSVRAGVQEYDT